MRLIFIGVDLIIGFFLENVTMVLLAGLSEAAVVYVHNVR